ncbi:hypothetical protein K7432_014289 [Basidiobolus ranarum]|uniref:Uncharacterized protein n=1 Tax=Basidiobolus ranarum TaxID=34480 RepID=A0ABR2VPP2_9FUNG
MDKINANLKYAAGYVQEIAGSLLGRQQMQAEGVAKQAQADSEYNAAQTQKNMDGIYEQTKSDENRITDSTIPSSHNTQMNVNTD